MALTLENIKSELDHLKKEVENLKLRMGYYIDEEGWLVFYNEKDYEDYIAKQDKPPTRIKACFVEKDGTKSYYSDEEATPEIEARFKRIGKDYREGKLKSLDELKKNLGL